MGAPKALLPDAEGRPFVARIVGTLADAGVPTIVVVTGSRHDAIAAALAEAALPVRPVLVRNPDPARGQLSSIWVGLDEAMAPDLGAVLMTLVDVPLTRVETVRRIVDAWRSTGAPIVRPAVGERHGHPVLFDRAVFEELRQAPLDQGAKAVLRAHADLILDVQVDDPGSVQDVDTPEEYRTLLDSVRSR